MILGVGDPEYGGTFEILMRKRLRCTPTHSSSVSRDLRTRKDDMTSVMMHAEVDGERLTSQEFGSFFILLVVAGNETTRNAISHGMRLLTMFPDQKKIWFGDFDNTHEDRGRRDRALVDAGHPLPPHRHRDTEIAGARSRPATRS